MDTQRDRLYSMTLVDTQKAHLKHLLNSPSNSSAQYLDVSRLSLDAAILQYYNGK